jgi:ABC-type lipoprotein export system ATPase subunit
VSLNSEVLLELCAVNCRRGDASIADVSLSLSVSSFQLLRGDNGSASLLLRIATMLELPDDGVVKLAGEPVEKLDESSRAAIRARHFGFVFDAPFLLPEMTVAENIAMPLFKVLDLEAMEARECTEATLNFARLEAVAITRAGELSLFDQQRVALARAIAHRPALLAIDRADTNLSAHESAEFLRLARRVRSELGISVLTLCTHPAEPLADERMIIMADGCVREETGVVFETPGQEP